MRVARKIVPVIAVGESVQEMPIWRRIVLNNRYPIESSIGAAVGAAAYYAGATAAVVLVARLLGVKI